MICAPRLLKCGKPFADYGFTTFQQPLLLLDDSGNPYVYNLIFVDFVVLTKGSTIADTCPTAGAGLPRPRPTSATLGF